MSLGQHAEQFEVSDPESHRTISPKHRAALGTSKGLNSQAHKWIKRQEMTAIACHQHVRTNHQGDFQDKISGFVVDVVVFARGMSKALSS